MKQILQSLTTGEISLEEVPCPSHDSNSLLIETTKSLVSAGTERMLLEFGKANLLGKVKQQPDKVKMVLDKIKTDGWASTLEAVKAKLEQPIPLGYCNVGHILEVGEDLSGFSVGDRIVSNGYHGEVVRVAKNLCAKIPSSVSDEEAAFTILGAIALQGLRLSQPTLGECYVVIGLGLIGLITVQLLLANGCRVLGIDFDESKCKLARQFGASTILADEHNNVLACAKQFSRGCGVDAVLITASTKSSQPLHQAASMCRKRGRIVLVGVIGSEFSRADFFEKELSFQVSCSYGPGRYDDEYEKKGHDYPIGFVRWTEQRNFEAVLDLMSSGTLNVKPLISYQFSLDEAIDAYHILETEKAVLGILLDYPSGEPQKKQRSSIICHQSEPLLQQLQVSFIGAGNYAARVLAPAFKSNRAYLQSIVSSQGISSRLIAKKIGFRQSLTDENLVYEDAAVDIVVIATRHDLHAQQVIKSLQAGKHVFVEKPIALTLEELDNIKEVYEKVDQQLIMVGFNRRFSPHIRMIKKALTNIHSPKSFVMTVNAGHIPVGHWTQDRKIGGGRIIGEVCHFIDLLRFLSGCKISAWHAISLREGCEAQADSVHITLAFSDGSCGSIQYLANGHQSFPKERLEIFAEGKILQLDNFRKMKTYGWSSLKYKNLWRQDKGQRDCVKAFLDAVSQGCFSPIAFEEIVEVAEVSIKISEKVYNE